MTNDMGRNQEFEHVINTDKKRYLDFFVTDFEYELDDIERTLDSEHAKILLHWVRDKLQKLQKEYHADL